MGIIPAAGAGIIACKIPVYCGTGYVVAHVKKKKMFPHAESALPFMNELMISITSAQHNVKLITNIFHL